ncbi:hypothetical protein [Alteribacillus sp. HJP-4]|uniref:hypothetical protein n=1 Tax=Alteribacillus sp. HJP-4 TaxID=2775394 RepID=UPI0035CCCB2E
MNISIFENTLQETEESIYYPHCVTQWLVKYRSIFGQREEKVIMMTDRVRGGSSRSDSLPSLVDKEVEPAHIMNAHLDISVCIDDAFETLRRYYLHQARSWSVPEINLMHSRRMYMSYQIYYKQSRFSSKSKTYLYEPASNTSDRVEKFPEVFQFIKERVEQT